MSSAAIESPTDRDPELSWTRNGMLAVCGIALASFVVHWIFNGRYGYFRDEFDYIACGMWGQRRTIRTHWEKI
ncbi:MAG: single-stranded DNA-binding protein [Acidobacteriia bacterium]|nr:single-stranded DNA-binding protein [Terriglobia bacterium]